MKTPSIGILGGAGAIASARFHLDLVQEWARIHDAKTDDDFPRIVHSSQSLGLSAEGLAYWPNTSILLLAALKSLSSCCQIAIVCNSVTQILPWELSISKRFLTPVAACRNALKDVRRAALLASDSTIRDEIYQRAYPEIDWRPVPVTPWIEDAIRGLRFNVGNVGVHSDEVIVLGCTELSTQVHSCLDLISPTDEMIKILCSL